MSTTIALSADEIDDLLYFTRANETEELKQSISELSSKYQTAPKEVIEACIDSTTGNTLLHYCSANGFTDLLPSFLVPSEGVKVSRELVNHRNQEGNTPLHWAAYNGHLPIVKLLVEAGADMWIKNAAGHLAMFEAERADRNEVVQYLLEAGGEDVEEGGEEGQAGANDVEEIDAEIEEPSSGASAGQ